MFTMKNGGVVNSQGVLFFFCIIHPPKDQKIHPLSKQDCQIKQNIFLALFINACFGTRFTTMKCQWDWTASFNAAAQNLPSGFPRELLHSLLEPCQRSHLPHIVPHACVSFIKHQGCPGAPIQLPHNCCGWRVCFTDTGVIANSGIKLPLLI